MTVREWYPVHPPHLLLLRRCLAELDRSNPVVVAAAAVAVQLGCAGVLALDQTSCDPNYLQDQDPLCHAL